MGTEILVLFLPIPFIIWLWNIKQITVRTTRKKGIFLLTSGIAFVLYMVFPFKSSQYLMQRIMFTGLLYLPAYLVFLFIIACFDAIKERRANVNKNT